MYRFENLPSEPSSIKKGQYRLGNDDDYIEIKDPIPIHKSSNSVVYSATRVKDSKQVVIKYIENQNDQFLERNSLSKYSFHPNIIPLIDYKQNHIVILEKGFSFGDSNKLYFGNKDFGDRCDLLRSMLCQYVVFLSFGHHEKIYQRDVKLENVTVIPSLYPDQPPHLKVIDFGFSANKHMAVTAILPSRKVTGFIQSVKNKTYHSHLMETYYLCLTFSNLADLRKCGFDNITIEDIKEISNLCSEDNATLCQVLKTNLIQERSIHIYNYLPNADHHYQIVKVKDIVQKIEEFKLKEAVIYIKYLSTPHIFLQNKVSFTNTLFPYYSINSVYIFPKEQLNSNSYQHTANIEKLKNVIGELLSNIGFLNDQQHLEEPHVYSFMSDGYFERFKKLKQDLADNPTYREVISKFEKISLDSLVKYFLGKMEYYQKETIGKKHKYYQKIQEYNDRGFGSSSINNINESFKLMDEAIKHINNELGSSIDILNYTEDLKYDEEVLNSEYFNAENNCLLHMEEFLSIGNSLSKKNMGIDFGTIKESLQQKKKSIILGNNSMDQLNMDISIIKKDIADLELLLKFLSDKSKILGQDDPIISDLPDEYQTLLKMDLQNKLDKNKMVREEYRIAIQISKKSKELQEKKEEALFLKHKYSQLNSNNNI